MMMLGSPPLLGILQCRLAPANNSSRDLSQATGQHVDQQQAASESLHTQENQLLHNQGTEKFSGYMEQLKGMSLPVRESLTKCCPLEKGMANHFRILALGTS